MACPCRQTCPHFEKRVEIRVTSRYAKAMVVLNRIYTRTGDRGETALGSGQRLSKAHLRIQAYGTVDETNATLGVVRLYTTIADLGPLDTMLARIQNELFDLGADLCIPDTGNKLDFEPLRILPQQYERLEQEIDQLNAELAPLRSFVLPGGHAAAAQLHVSRTVCRRAERLIVELGSHDGEHVNKAALAYINRLSDFLFVASRWVNAKTTGDILWVPGKTR
jgi:cob(I)alamin adenosyltransferase